MRTEDSAILQKVGNSIVESLAVAPESDLPTSVQRALQLARLLQNRANELQTPQERRQQAELDRMIHHPHDKITGSVNMKV